METGNPALPGPPGRFASLRRPLVDFLLSEREEGGQVMAYLAFFLFLTLLFIVLVMNIGTQVTKKIEMQNAADTAAFAGATWACRGLNLISLLNVTSTQFISLIICLDALDETADICYALAQAQEKLGEATAEFGGFVLIPPAILAQIVCKFVTTTLKQPIEKFIDILWKIQEVFEKVEKAITLVTPVLGEVAAFYTARANGATLGFVLPAPMAPGEIPLISNELVKKGKFKDFARPVHEGDDSGVGGYGIPEDEPGKQAVPEFGINIPVAGSLTHVKRGGAPLQYCRLFFQMTFGLLTVFGTFLASPMVFFVMTEVKYYALFGLDQPAGLTDATVEQAEADPYKVREWYRSEEAARRDGVLRIKEIKWHYTHVKSRNPDYQPPGIPNTKVVKDEDQVGPWFEYMDPPWAPGTRRITPQDVVVENSQNLQDQMEQAGLDPSQMPATGGTGGGAEPMRSYVFVKEWTEDKTTDDPLYPTPDYPVYDENGVPIKWTIYHREEAVFLGAKIEKQLVSDSQAAEAAAETSGAGEDHGKPYLLVDDWKEKVDYVGLAWMRPGRARAPYIPRYFREGYTETLGMITFAQTKIYNPTRTDTFTQDWRQKLVRFSKHEKLINAAGEGLVAKVQQYLQNETIQGYANQAITATVEKTKELLRNVITH